MDTFARRQSGWGNIKGRKSNVLQVGWVGVKNNERPELSRVQDARAALPQNCSPMKIRRLQNAAYGTIELYIPRKCYTDKALKIKMILVSATYCADSHP